MIPSLNAGSLPAPTGVSSLLIETTTSTTATSLAPAAVGMGDNSAELGLGLEQHLTADVVGIGSYPL